MAALAETLAASGAAGHAASPAASRVPEHDRVADPSALAVEVQSVLEYLPAALAGLMAGVGVVTLLFWGSIPAQVLMPWLAAFSMLWLVRLFMLQRYRRALRTGDVDWAVWRRMWNLTTLASGILWGVTAWLFYGRGSGVQQTGLIMVVYTYCISAVPVLANQPRLYLGFAALCFGPMIVRIAGEGDTYSLQLAGVMLLIVSLTTVLARNYRQALRRVTDLKLHSDELLRQLRVEKQAVEAARHEAVVANRAKTQFFAAASHDLRQPLHAMGLFAEALRQRTREPEVAQLVNSINESVDALEGLFSELLDITRIDSGGLEVHAEDFEVGDILRKLRLHFEPAAFEKGLALRLRGGRHAVRADPLLVERIVRNLVSNAIRYTEDGSVLVSFRRRGTSVLLQVWDTGVGIGEHERSRIFEEFYQVPGRRVVTADQRKGLGLGLAIVTRLATLIGAPLELHSEPGHGTVFTLVLPAGQAPRAAPNALPAKGPIDITLERRLIVVVEDEPAVRAGLEVLLRGWGATIESFGSVDAADEWLARTDALASPPALAIVDYRLEQGRNGVDAIVALRRRFGAGLPAIVVTGSTTSALEGEAQAHDFHLLVKPVLPNKLRAMISFKLAAKAVEHEPSARAL